MILYHRATIIFAAAGLYMLSSIAFDKTFIKTEIVFFLGLFGGLVGTAIVKALYRKHNLPFWIILIYGMFSGAAIPIFLVVVPNYCLRGNETFKKELDIVRTEKKPSGRNRCKVLYAVLIYKDIEKEVLFPCEYENSISNFKKVRLELSEGFLGFEIIEKEELVL